MKQLLLLICLLCPFTAIAEDKTYEVVVIVSDKEETVHVIFYNPETRTLSLHDGEKTVFKIPNVDYSVLGEVVDFYVQTHKPVLKRGPR